MPGTRKPSRHGAGAGRIASRGTGQRGGPTQSARRILTRPLAKHRRLRHWIYISAALTVAVLVIGSFALVPLLSLSPRGTGATSYKDGVGVPQDLMPSVAHRDGEELVYNTTPPTSGEMWNSPARCGFYEEGLRDEIVVHNLEHGAVVVSYNITDPAFIARLREAHDGLGGNANWLITRFYPEIDEGEVALAAWGVLDQFTGIDEERIKRFFNAYRGNRFSGETSSLGRGIACI